MTRVVPESKVLRFFLDFATPGFLLSRDLHFLFRNSPMTLVAGY